MTQGLAGFAQRSQAVVRTLSARLIDAKAGGIAARLDGLATELFRVPEDQRADVSIERLSSLVLIAAAYRRQNQLPAALREDILRAGGWTQKREELLATASAPRVAANLGEVQPDKLRRLETWLVNTSADSTQPRVALLVDYVPVSGGGFGFAFEPGQSIDGEVVFYPSAAPLRGLMASRKSSATLPAWPTGHRGISPAIHEFAARLEALPWLDTWPLLASGVEIRAFGKGQLALSDATGRALPIVSGQSDA